MIIYLSVFIFNFFRFCSGLYHLSQFLDSFPKFILVDHPDCMLIISGEFGMSQFTEWVLFPYWIIIGFGKSFINEVR